METERRKRAGGTGGRAAAFLLALCLCLAALPPAPAPGAGEGGGLRMRVSRDALWYTGEERAQLEVILENPEPQQLDGVSLVLRVYPPCAKRTELAEFRAGKTRGAREALTLESGIKLDPGARRLSYSVDLSALGLQEGAWPYAVEASRRGVQLARWRGFLLVQQALHGQPITLIPLWEMHYAPQEDALGRPVDSGLYAACGGEEGGGGFLRALLSTLERHPGLKTTLACSSQSLQSLLDGADRPGVKEAATSLRGSVEEGRLYLMQATYSYAYLDLLARRGWREDARQQLARGQAGLRDLAPKGRPAGFFPPGFNLGPESLALLEEEGLGFTVASEQCLAGTPQGAAAVSAARAGFPVRLQANESAGLGAWVADEQVYAYLAGIGDGASGQEVVENLLAEAFLMQAERAAEKRAYLLAFPESFRPPGELLGQLYDALAAAPWVETAFPDAALDDVPPRDPRPVPLLPGQATLPDPYGELEEVRGLTLSYREVLFQENPLGEALLAGLLLAEGADLYLEGSATPPGRQVLEGLSGRIREEMAGIRLQEHGSVTLASTRGELTVVVSNLNPYPIKAQLSLSDTSVSFPEGNRREVVVNPQDNRFKFAVETSRKGSFLLDIRLAGEGDLVISSSTVNLKTSSLNTLALTFLAGLLGILLLALLLRKMRHWGRRGKHERC